MEVKPIVWMNENRGEIGAMVAIIPTTSSFHVFGESSLWRMVSACTLLYCLAALAIA
jgi:hypothetical protein